MSSTTRSSLDLVNNLSQIKELDNSLEEVEKCLKPIAQVDFVTLLEAVSPYEAASAEIAFAYSLAILFHTVLNLKGGAHPSHPIFDELKRIQSHISRLVESRKAGTKKRKIVVDREASRRIIMHKLSENNV